jgi:hypothetical protein
MTIAVIETVENNTTSLVDTLDVVFSGIPTDGELIVLFTGQDAAAVFTFPAGFTELTLATNVQMAWKVASSEASATYTIDSDQTNEMAVHGLRASKDAGATWAFLAEAGGATFDGTAATTGDADGSSATGDFLAYGSGCHLSTDGSWSGASSFGGTATGGTDTEEGDTDPSTAQTDVSSTSASRIFTGAGTVSYTPKVPPDVSPFRTRLALFEEQAGGAPNTRRYSLTLTGIG